MGKDLTRNNGRNDLGAAVRSCMEQISEVFNSIRNGETELVAKIDDTHGLFRRRITISTHDQWVVTRIDKSVAVRGEKEMIAVINDLLHSAGIDSVKLSPTVLRIDPFTSRNQKFKQFPSSS